MICLDQRNSTVVEVLALHVANPSSISGTTDGLRALLGVNP